MDWESLVAGVIEGAPWWALLAAQMVNLKRSLREELRRDLEPLRHRLAALERRVRDAA